MTKPSSWWALRPSEFWQLLWKLTQQQQVQLRPNLYPKYTSPYADRELFHAGLAELETWLVIHWENPNNRNQVRRIVRQVESSELEDFLRQHCPEDSWPPEKRTVSDTISAADQARCQAAVASFGPLGLRTLAHLAFGDSHRLDGWRQLTAEHLAERLGLQLGDCWMQPDAADRDTGNIARLAGHLAAHYPGAVLHPRWMPPGHYLWPWDVTELEFTAVGEYLLLIENPYPMWELLRRWEGQPVTMLCLHGETHFERGESSALGHCLRALFAAKPRFPVHIWCDPDLAGLRIAQNAYDWVTELGGVPAYWNMEASTLMRLTSLVLAEQKLRPLSPEQRQQLENLQVSPELEDLRAALLKYNAVGEQEALAVDMIGPA